MATFADKTIAVAALGNHPGFALLKEFLQNGADEHAQQIYDAVTPAEEQQAVSRWRGYKFVLAAISGLIENAQQEVSVEHVDPTRFEQSPLFTEADFKDLIKNQSGNDLLALLTDSDTIDSGEEQ